LSNPSPERIMTDASPLSWLDAQLSSRPLTALVFFRGDWCPWCQGYLRELSGPFLRDLRAAGGELIGVTAQSEAGARSAHSAWALDYPVVSDPSLALARRFDIAITPKAQTPLAGVEGEYPHGMSQPGVVILDDTGKILVRWAIDPSEMNGGGALDRPLPPVLWAALKAALAGEPVSLQGPRLDPAWLKANYPDAYTIFEAWMASASTK
jgi:peroxiredoxin